MARCPAMITLVQQVDPLDEQSLRRCMDKLDHPPDLVLLSGGLARTGLRSEFARAQAALLRIAAAIDLPPSRFVVAPAPGDVSLKACEAYFASCEAEERPPERPYWPKLEHFADFTRSFYEGPARIDEARPFGLHVFTDLRLVVVALSSLQAYSHRSEERFGWLGADQLRAAAAALRPYKEQGYLRIGLVHHDPRHMESDLADRDQRDFHDILSPQLSVLVQGEVVPSSIAIWDGLPVCGPVAPVPTMAYELGPDQLRAIPDGPALAHRFGHAGATFHAPPPELAETASELAAALRSYRAEIDRTERRLALVDLALGGEDRELPAGLDLLGVFIPPKVSPRGGLAAPGRVPRALPVAGVIAEVPWALIVGAPGSGKTALLRWITLRLCAPGEGIAGIGEDLVPIRIELRRFDERRRAAGRRSYGFLDFVDELHAERGLSLRGQVLRRLAEERRILWLFDGLDEVIDAAERLRCAADILALHSAGGRGLLTSRVLGCEAAEEMLAHNGVPAFHLLDFDEQQICSFLDRWHALAFAGHLEVGPRRRQRLAHALAESAALWELAKSPLLLTLIALLNRGGALPRARHRLYDRAIELCAQQWEANKHLDLLGEPLDLRDRILLLRRIAWSMMAEVPGGAGNIVDAATVQRIAAAFRQERYGEEADTADHRAAALVGELMGRNGILTAVGGQSLGFLHRAFLEQLAAQEIAGRYRGHRLDLPQLGELLRSRWQEPDWGETICLLCGMLAEDGADTVMELLQGALRDVPIFEPSLGDTSALSRWTALALRCLAEEASVEQEPLRGFCQKLMELIEPLVLGPIGAAEQPIWAALRRFGPRWPEPERWLSLALRYKDEAAGNDLFSPAGAHKSAAFSLVISSVEPSQRVALLKVLLDGEQEPLRCLFAIYDASNHGPWMAEEVHELLRFFMDRDERLWASVCGAVFAGMISGAEGILDATLRVDLDAESDEARQIRLAKALEMLRPHDMAIQNQLDRFCRQGAGRGLLTATQVAGSRRDDLWRALLSESSTMRDEAARTALLGVAEMVIHGLVSKKRLSDNPASIAGMLVFAAHWLIDRMAGWDPEVLVLAARLALARYHGQSKERVREIIEEVAQRSPSNRVRAGLALYLRNAPWKEGLAWLGEQAAALLPASMSPLLNSATRSIVEGNGAALCCYIEEGLAGRTSVPQDVFLIMVSHLQPALIVPGTAGKGEAADAFVRPLNEAIEAGNAALTRIAREGQDEQLRVLAILALCDLRPEEGWLEVLREAAPRLTDPQARLRAARALGDEGTLIDLVQRGDPKDVSEQAAHALRILRLVRSLLAHGKRRRGIVALAGRRVGIIEETRGGSRFVYDAAWLEQPGAIPISPTLPLRPEPFEEAGLLSFFSNLLPEGWLLDLTCTKLNIDPRDRFGLLLATGADCAGAVEVLREPEA